MKRRTTNLVSKSVVVEEKVEAVKEAVEEKVEAVKEAVEEKVEAVKEAVEEKVEAVKEEVEEKVEAVKEEVEEKLESVKEAVEEKVEAVKEVVEDVVPSEILKVVEEAIPDSCSFMCLGWLVSLRKVPKPLKMSQPISEETPKTDSKSESPSAPAEESQTPKAEPTA